MSLSLYTECSKQEFDTKLYPKPYFRLLISRIKYKVSGYASCPIFVYNNINCTCLYKISECSEKKENIIYYFCPFFEIYDNIWKLPVMCNKNNEDKIKYFTEFDGRNYYISLTNKNIFKNIKLIKEIFIS